MGYIVGQGSNASEALDNMLITLKIKEKKGVRGNLDNPNSSLFDSVHP